jgi:hypothetical protein
MGQSSRELTPRDSSEGQSDSWPSDGPGNTGVFGVRPTAHIIAGRLSPGEENAVSQWISLNAAALLACREGEIDAIQLGNGLKMLPAPQGS